MITLKYLGKKTDFTLSFPPLTRSYHVKGPGDEVDFEDRDATHIVATNPKMFRVHGIKTEPVKEEVKAPPVKAEKPKPATTPPAEVPDPPETQETSEEAARKMLVDDPPPGNVAPLADDLRLTGDGVDGDVKEAVPTAILMTYKEAELRIYAMQRFGHEFTEQDKRLPMIKKIKELEQAKAQAAS